MPHGGKGVDKRLVAEIVDRRHEDLPDESVRALVAAAADGDLVAPGSRGLHGLKSLGSVSERLAHKAQSSVLIVRNGGIVATACSYQFSDASWRSHFGCVNIAGVDLPVELRQLRYFVAVAEELHFGRAAERLQMSQSPLSRAIRELERELGVVLFVRTTRRVELTDAGSALLERARRALAEIDAAIGDVRRTGEPGRGVVTVGHGPFSGSVAKRITSEFASEHPEVSVALDEDVTPELLRRVAARELVGAAVMETPAAARRYGVRVDTLRDEPLLAALPASHAYAAARSIPVSAFAEECVLLPREPVGRVFNAWLRAVVRGAGSELERTRETLSAPWDRRMRPVAEGETVSVFVGDWAEESGLDVVAVPFDPPLTFPVDFASALSPAEPGVSLLETARRMRDVEGWLTHRRTRTDVPGD